MQAMQAAAREEIRREIVQETDDIGLLTRAIPLIKYQDIIVLLLLRAMDLKRNNLKKELAVRPLKAEIKSGATTERSSEKSSRHEFNPRNTKSAAHSAMFTSFSSLLLARSQALSSSIYSDCNR